MSYPEIHSFRKYIRLVSSSRFIMWGSINRPSTLSLRILRNKENNSLLVNASLILYYFLASQVKHANVDTFSLYSFLLFYRNPAEAKM